MAPVTLVVSVGRVSEEGVRRDECGEGECEESECEESEYGESECEGGEGV